MAEVEGVFSPALYSEFEKHADRLRSRRACLAASRASRSPPRQSSSLPTLDAVPGREPPPAKRAARSMRDSPSGAGSRDLPRLRSFFRAIWSSLRLRLRGFLFGAAPANCVLVVRCSLVPRCSRATGTALRGVCSLRFVGSRATARYCSSHCCQPTSKIATDSPPMAPLTRR